MTAGAARTRQRGRFRRRVASFVPRLIAAGLAFGAEGIHLSILADQAALWWGYGVFFLVVASAQGLLGASLLFGAPSRGLAGLDAAFSLGLVAIWAVTRIGGIPGVRTFYPLPVEGVDLAAALMEVGLAAMLLLMGRRAPVSGRDKDQVSLAARSTVARGA